MSSGVPGDEYGAVIQGFDLSESRVYIGAPGDNAETGAVYLHTDYSDEAPTKITAGADEEAGARFGSSLVVDDSLATLKLIVGAPGEAGEQGAVYAINGPTRRLVGPDAAAEDRAGVSVGISCGPIAFIAGDDKSCFIGAGAPGHGEGGAVFFWSWDENGSGAPNPEPTLLPPGTMTDGYEFGSLIAMKSLYLVVGATNPEGGSGEVFLYTAAGDSVFDQLEPRKLVSDSGSSSWWSGAWIALDFEGIAFPSGKEIFVFTAPGIDDDFEHARTLQVGGDGTALGGTFDRRLMFISHSDGVDVFSSSQNTLQSSPVWTQVMTIPEAKGPSVGFSSRDEDVTYVPILLAQGSNGTVIPFDVYQCYEYELPGSATIFIVTMGLGFLLVLVGAVLGIMSPPAGSPKTE